MPVPAGYYYKDGFYWKADLSGPYAFDGGSTMTLLGAGEGGGGGPVDAADVTIVDAGGHFTATNVEGALAELATEVAAGPTSMAASAVTVVDAGGHYTSTHVEGALAEIGVAQAADDAALATHIAAADPHPVYTVYRGIVDDEAEMVALSSAVPGNYVKRTDTNTNWQLDALPPSAAANWRNLGTIFQTINGRDYMIGPGGIILPLTPVVGTYAQATVAGVKQATVELNSGNDANPHNNWALIYDCTLAGQPGVPNDALAGEQFERADPNEIIVTGLPGNVMAGIVYFPEFNTLSMVHIAQLGGSSYTNPGTVTAGLNQMVRLDFPEGTIGLEIQAREPTGTNGRTRQVVFTPFLARGA